VHLVLRQYRRDVFAALKPDLEIHYAGQIMPDPDHNFLYHGGMSTLLGQEPHLVSGNRQDNKYFAEMYDFTFDVSQDLESDRETREHWSMHPYRCLLRHALTIFERVGGRDLQRRVHQYLKQETIRYHWLYANANKRNFLQMDHGRRGFWSLLVDPQRTGSQRPGQEKKSFDRVVERGDGLPSHTWGGPRFTRGSPPELPKYLSWSARRWEQALRLNMV